MLIIPKGKRGKGESISITHFIIWQEVGKALGKGELRGSLGLFLLCIQLRQRPVEVLVFLLPDGPEPWTQCCLRCSADDLPGGSDSQESACDGGDPGSLPGSGRFPWRREWQPSPVLLPDEFHGQRSLAAAVCGVTKSQTQLSDSTIAAPD